MTTPESGYVSPLTSRYLSPEMSHLFSEEARALCFRKLWIALARAQKSLGLPIHASQIEEMESHLNDIDFPSIRAYEATYKHDVMAHIHAFGDLCPKAKGILHLGATSCYVTDNGDLILYKKGFDLLLRKLVQVIRALHSFARKEAETPCLGYTHFQSAQPTTIGKRSCLWLQDFLFDAHEWERQIHSLPFLGAKGATGTQSSFLTLFKGNHSKVEKMEELIAKEMGFSHLLPISGQTYPRKIDLQILNALASFAASAHKMGTDVRLLAHEGELFESFEKKQVGSSAMPHKRNPIYSERICGLSRFVISLSQNGAYTAATQWLERSLDDSSNRRLTLPEAFLATDSILNILYHLVSHLEVAPQTAREHLEKELPLLMMENILMEAVLLGKDRQEVHEVLRQLATKGAKSLPSLIQEMEKALGIPKKTLHSLLNIDTLIGCAPRQVDSFIKKEVEPFLERFQKTTVLIPAVEI